MYESPDMEIIELNVEDTVRTSGGNDWDTDVIKPTA